ncbi:Vitamin D3 receptor A [Orchesella cincta]|uniref:Vitamin D3 receptor A n=1 Tax=Orchesella cincta TaxID=48709 RepID=A0A1D2MVI2_ORCCI|nr:Vitamin D3 receptor A [Orchesella cincta]
MDHPAGKSIIRPEPRLAQPQNHYQSALQQQPSGSGSAGGVGVVDRSFLLESSIFRGPGTIGAPSHATSGEFIAPSSSPPSSYGEGKGFSRKRSRKRPKTCGVCGDRAKSFHFGGLSCDSCKAFFRRSVQNDAHVAFRCAYDSCCDINISTRKSCQFCRFKKCLAIGMEKSWVMTEEERNALNQQRLEKKQTKPVATVQQPPVSEPTYTFQGTTKSTSVSREPAALAFLDSEYVADVDKMLDYMTYEEQLEIKSVVETYLHAYKEMPFRVSLAEGRRDTLEIIEMFTTILRRFAYFSKLVPEFADLSRADQGNLLRAAVLEMCLLRGAACFDTEKNRWPSSTMESLKDCPQLRVEDMQRLVSRELFEMHISFIFHMKKLRIDEPIAMLLIMTVLFSPERVSVESRVRINQSQEKYLMLLKKYVSWKFGTTAGSRIYPQLLTKLSDLRQLNDFHTEFHLNLDRNEVNAIKKSLMELHLNPYPNWKIVPESRQSSPEQSRPSSPILPAPSPFVESGPSSLPRATQTLIQSFADRRIPTLLDNPYAVFETDLGLIRQVQQTFALSAYNQSLHQRHPSEDSDGSRMISIQDQLANSETFAPNGGSSSVSPRGHSSSTESTEISALDILHNSRSHEYQPPSLTNTTTSSSCHSEALSALSGEYHVDRLQQFLQHRGQTTGLEPETVLRGHNSSISTTGCPHGSQTQTVLRKHSSGSSLPSTPSSVIRSAHSRPVDPPINADGRLDARSFRSISCSTVSGGGWHGGEVHTTTNGHRTTGSTSTVTVTTATRTQPSSYEGDPS